MDYRKASIKAQEYKEANDCSVKAVSIACDVAYSVAHKALQWQGRANKRGVNLFQIEAAVSALGYSFVPVDTTAATATTLSRCPNLKKGCYIALFRGHVAAVVNGRVEDWTEGRRHHVITVFKVSPNKTRKERRHLINSMMCA